MKARGEPESRCPPAAPALLCRTAAKIPGPQAAASRRDTKARLQKVGFGYLNFESRTLRLATFLRKLANAWIPALRARLTIKTQRTSLMPQERSKIGSADNRARSGRNDDTPKNSGEYARAKRIPQTESRDSGKEQKREDFSIRKIRNFHHPTRRLRLYCTESVGCNAAFCLHATGRPVRIGWRSHKSRIPRRSLGTRTFELPYRFLAPPKSVITRKVHSHYFFEMRPSRASSPVQTPSPPGPGILAVPQKKNSAIRPSEFIGVEQTETDLSAR